MNDRITPLPDYETVAASLGAYSPAELHGMLCGLLCLDDSVNADTWLGRIATDTDLLEVRDPEQLQALFFATTAQINSQHYSFSLLLPDDDMNMSVRAESLGDWCQGLLAGLGLGGLTQNAKAEASGEVQEFLDDVSQIARVGLDGDHPDEEDEAAYAEIVEYLRMGLLLTSQEFSNARAARSQANALH